MIFKLGDVFPDWIKIIRHSNLGEILKIDKETKVNDLTKKLEELLENNKLI